MELHAGKDPLVTLVATTEGVSIVVVLPEQFTTLAFEKNSTVSMENLEAKDTIVSGRIIIPKFTEDSLLWAVRLRSTIEKRASLLSCLRSITTFIARFLTIACLRQL